MELKSLLAAVLAELKKFGEGQHSALNQIFYFALVLGKVAEHVNLPWWMVVGLPLVSPAHVKDAYAAISGAIHKFVDELGKIKK